MKHRLFIGLFCLVGTYSFSQEDSKVWDTFEGTRALNNHSTEMLYKKQFEFIVAHKFGNLAESDAVERWFGLDDLADVRIAFEYGITNKFNIGLGRNKGVGIIRQMVDGYAKYRFLQQDNKTPVNLTWVSSMGVSFAKASTDLTAANSYSIFSDRLIYTHQAIVSRKFNDHLSLQINLGANHRNFVGYTDINTLYFAGGTARVRFNSVLGALVEYNHVLNRSTSNLFQNPLSFGIEMLTGGHAFTFIFSNSRGVNENIFIPATSSNWLDGQFRLGFSITRKFKV